MEKIAEEKTVLELKKELRRVMEALVVDDDDDGFDLGFTDNAIQTLCALKELKLKQRDCGFVKLKNLDFQDPPLEFRCPISGILMQDPVVAASGQTFEELSIRKWLKEGNRKCPETDQLLAHTVLIPNHSIKKMIVNWSKTSKGDVPSSNLTCGREFGEVTKEHLVNLLESVSSSSSSDKKVYVKELLLLTTRLPSVRSLLGEIKGAISQLLSPFLIKGCYSDAALCDDVVATILNISIDDRNKRKIVEGSPLAVSLLTEALRSENIETRGCAAAALSALSTVDSNKLIIGESGAVEALIKLLEEGHPLALRDVASAVLNLCTLIENKERALSEGVVTAVIDKLVARVLIDDMLEILARFSSHQRAIDEMEEYCMIYHLLFSILREDTSERSKENCVAIVHTMCFGDRRRLVKINEVERAHETLFRVASTGTSRARRKATGLLERLNRFYFLSHTA